MCSCRGSGLSDYCATKAATIALHNSIRLGAFQCLFASYSLTCADRCLAELRKARCTKVHSTVVLPYHIDTGMFDGVTFK